MYNGAISPALAFVTSLYQPTTILPGMLSMVITLAVVKFGVDRIFAIILLYATIVAVSLFILLAFLPIQ